MAHLTSLSLSPHTPQNVNLTTSFKSQTLNEIMPMIYRRFTEKSAEEWRQIYKALQLLEFLIKHGSERVIDDARGHLTLLKMLRQFHFIDPNGKDQGINVRNRAKELADLLSDVERIRSERKKARANKQKYTGVEGGMSFGGGMSGSGSGSRFGGFGNESSGYGGYSGGVYGDGGGFGGQSDDFRETSSGTRREKFEEYDEFDEAERPAASHGASPRAGVKRTTGGPAKKAEAPKKKEPEIDLFSFDEPTAATSVPVAAPSNSAGLSALTAADDDDDFDDFQSATPAAQQTTSLPGPMTSNASGAMFAAPQPVSAPKQANLSEMVGMSSISPPPPGSASTPGANYSSFSTPLSTGPAAQPLKPSGYQPSGPNYFQSVQVNQQQPQAKPASTPGMGMSAMKPAGAPAAKSAATGGDAFGALWSQASIGLKKTDTASPGQSMGQLAKEKSSAGIWGAPGGSMAAAKPGTANQQQQSGSSAFGDLLG
jgi:epsin